MRFHTRRREQWTPRSLKEVFGFFSELRNLEAITPPWLKFEIVTREPIRLARGAQIDYRLRVHGAPMQWTTEIRRWRPPHGFVDSELRGPYVLWSHSHRFDEGDGGTRMRDVVRYRLPFGPLGRLLNRLVAARDLRSIFDYRAAKIRDFLGGKLPDDNE
jgi:ligand-binding SRPBCC domain-containing protein